jgi:hypothetical protein
VADRTSFLSRRALIVLATAAIAIIAVFFFVN